MSAHTPGPLTTKVTASQRFDQRGDTAIRKDGQIIGEAYARSSMDQRWPAEANARLWAAAPQLAEALRDALLVLNEGVSSDCAHCGGEGGWEDRERDAHGRVMTEPRMTPVEHRADCVIVQARAALRAAGVEP